jgi:uncharacterized protein YfaS (alpha-2-macroglobulin family)
MMKKIYKIFGGVLVGLLLLLFVIRIISTIGKSGVEVTSVDPLGQVDRKTNITIEFSRDMVAASQMNVASDSLAVVFKPGIPGQYKWISPRRLRFFPNLPLRPATEYTLEILPEICTQKEIYLEGERRFTFYTAPLQVEQCQLSAVPVNRKLSQIKIEFSLKFNDQVDPAGVQNFISLHTDKDATGDKLNFTRKTNAADETLIFESEPFTLKEKKQYFSVRVARGLVGLGGQLGLTDDFTRSIQVGDGEPLKLITMYPTTSRTNHSIVIKFSTEIVAAEAKAFITIEPKIAFELQVQGRQVQLDGLFLPGQEYQVTLTKGLPAQNLTVLEKELSQVIFIENLEPNITYIDGGFYLPRKGNRQVGVETINIEKIEIEIYQIFENNLVHLLNQQNPFNEYFYFDTYGARYLGKKLFSEEIKIQSRLNEPIQTAIDLSRFLDAERKGIFSVVVRDVEYRWRSASKAVILTDMGLMAHRAADELLVWAHSLTDLKPVAGAQLSLISVNNQLLDSGVTGPDGLLKITNLKEKIGEFEPLVLVAALGADLSFLQFHDCQIATSDFEVSGRLQLVDGYEAVLYPDRGVYRPGETVHLVSVVRDKNLAVPPSFPIRLEIVAPDNRIFQEMRGTVGAGGACEFNISFPNYAQTGKYLAKLMVSEQELGRVAFSVEEFIPDRIKVTLKTERDEYRTGESVPINVQAVNLFGPPASGRRAESVCEIQEIAFQPAKYQTYTFGDAEKTFDKMEIKLGTGVLDAEGKYQFTLALPENLLPASSLRGVITATVIEPGGRAVSIYKGIDIHPYPFYLGLRPQQEGYTEVGKESRFEFVALDPAGNLRETRGLDVKIFNIVWQSILQRDENGSYGYVSEFTENEIQIFKTDAVGGKGVVQFTPKNYGEYRIQIVDPTSQSSTSVNFYASGWGYAPWSMSHPDRLEIEFDKKEYQVGETAKALIKAPFSGKLILCIEREKVFETREVTLTENTASIDLPVKESYQPNVYLTGTLIRSIKSLEKHAPVRAFGTAPLMVNCQSQQLPVEIKAVSEMRPRNVLEVEVAVPGTSADAFLTLAAVDEGICQLTDFQTPDLFAFFYAKRRLQVEAFDFYNYILPEFTSETSSSSAGDRLDGVRRKHLTPVDASRVKPVALWAGLIHLGSRGRTKIKLDIPEFNGKLRLMAVAFDGANFGNASQHVTVRDPIVLTPTFPRFVAPKDSFRIPVQVFNGTGKPADFQVTLKVTGAARINNPTTNLSVPDKGEATAIFQVAAQEGMGTLKFSVTAEGNGESVKTEREIPLRPPVPLVSQTGSGVVTSKPVQLQIPANWLPGTETYQLTTSGFPTMQFGGSLQYLLRYPYGCIEQTTSQVFPLLYFKEMALAAEPKMFTNSTVEYFLEEGIQRISNMQLASGGFAYWPGGAEPNAWGSIYVAHFLVEARKAGFSIPNRVYDKALGYLNDPGFSKNEFFYTNDLRTYALYVLSAAGQPDKSSMIYLKNNVLKEMSASNKYLLAGAFGLSGDLKTAQELLPVTIQPQSLPRETGGIFNSSVRTNAIILNVLAELFPQNPSVPVLAKWLADEVKSGHWGNTQENAWALLALGKALKKNPQAQFTGKILVDQKKYGEFGAESKTVTGAELGGKKIELVLEGTGPAYFYWQAEGIPRDLNIEESDHGLSVRRVLLNRDGKPLDYQQIQQGDLVVAQISMTALDKPLENVIVADLLPAGLEIENPRLESRADVAWIKDQAFLPDYMDIRDDRLILFITLPERSEQKFYYALRAVTAGQFTLPPIKAEAMYDPVYRSVASSGVVRVREMR